MNKQKAVCIERCTYSLVGGQWKRAVSAPRQWPTQHYLALFLGTIVEEKESADDGEYTKREKGVDRCTSWWWRTSSAWHSCCVASCWRSATRLISRTTGGQVSIWP